jgi:hypothetical protein
LLVKGVLTHWQIKLSSDKKTHAKQLLKGLDIKFPLLIGDQYHTIAYYIVARLGNLELVRLLTVIEENFQKIFFGLDKILHNFSDNLDSVYQHFYNYLPQFMGNSLKGVAIIFELDKQLVQQSFQLGVELGYFYQFGIFSYIMTAVINQAEKQAVKDHLRRISNMLQFLSFEFIENLLYKTKTLNFRPLQSEFLLLTEFHAEQTLARLDSMELEEEMKAKLREGVQQFRRDLFAMAKFDPKTASSSMTAA